MSGNHKTNYIFAIKYLTGSQENRNIVQDFMEHYLKAPITCLAVSEEHADVVLAQGAQ